MPTAGDFDFERDLRLQDRQCASVKTLLLLSLFFFSFFVAFFFFRLGQVFAPSFSMFEGCATCRTVELNCDEGVLSNYEQVTSVCLKILCFTFFFLCFCHGLVLPRK